jgi:bacteriorhodopsin
MVDVYILMDLGLNVSKDKPKHTETIFQQSFTVCYLVLFGTAAITFIEALRTNNIHARHILNLETAVSLTAGFVYGWFREMAAKPDFNLKEVIYYRYVDWSITTPMLLLVLLLFFTFHSKQPLSISKYLLIVALNFVMLWFGYMGEKGLMEKRKAQNIGFLAFAAMLFTIYYFFIHGDNIESYAPLVLFAIFSIVWCGYGVAAEMDDRSKNLAYNVLDIISKVFFGLGLWVYYGGVAGV